MIGGCTCPAVLELLCPVEVASPEASKEHLSTISTEGCVECEEGTFPFGALFLVLSNAIRYNSYNLPSLPEFPCCLHVWCPFKVKWNPQCDF